MTRNGFDTVLLRTCTRKNSVGSKAYLPRGPSRYDSIPKSYHNNILVLMADKGNATVLMDREESVSYTHLTLPTIYSV